MRPNPHGASATGSPLAGASQLGVWLTMAACFTLPWNGVTAGSLRPGDLLVIVAIVTLLVADPGRRLPRLPWWSGMFAAIVVLITAVHEILPTDEQYLRSRVVVDAAGHLIPEIYTNSLTGVKLVLGVAGLAFMTCLAAAHDRRSLLRAAVAFACGTAVSAVAAFGETLGVLNVGISNEGTRSGGLAVQANFLGETCAMSIPISMYLLTRPDSRSRILGGVVTVCLAIGAYSSGSRGGSVALLATAVLAAVLMREYRKFLPTIALVLGVAAAGLFVAMPSAGQKLLSSVRLDNSASAQGSDIVRALVAQQGSRDFTHSPIDGVGLQVAAEAHNVYLQALASGGLILLVAYVAYLLGCAVTGVGLLRRSPLAAPFLTSVAAVVALDFVENSFADRLAYFPPALVAALWSVTVARRSTDSTEPSLP